VNRIKFIGACLLLLVVALLMPSTGRAGAIDEAQAGIDAAEAGKYEEAILILDRVLSSTQYLPQSVLAACYLRRGYSYGMKHDYIKAIADYNQVIKLEPENADAYYFRGLSHYAQGQTKLSLIDVQQAYKMDPNVKAYKIVLDKIKKKLESESDKP
jgi:tetratricopeptide (TPR) repeat protein